MAKTGGGEKNNLPFTCRNGWNEDVFCVLDIFLDDDFRLHN